MSMRVFSRPEEIRQLEEMVNKMNHVIAFEMQEAMRDHNEGNLDICEAGLAAQTHLKRFLQTIKLYGE